MKIGYLMQLGEEIRFPPYSGPANHVRHVIEELRRGGHSVRLLIRLGDKIWRTDDLADFQSITVELADRGPLRWLEKVVRWTQSKLHLPYLGLFESLRFALACRQELQGSVVYLERFSWMSYGGVLASRWLGVPLVLEYNGDPLLELDTKGEAPQGVQRRISVWLMRWVFTKAAFIVASGNGWRDNCIDRWNVPPGKVTTIENGTELVRLLRRDQLHSFGSIPSPADPVNLVYLGNFYAWHGVLILLRAFSSAIKQGANLRLRLIGAGAGFEDAQELASQLELNGFVNFMGRLPVEEYGLHLGQADIGLSPYCGWNEYSGLKLFDYKAAGLACIASGKDGQPVTLKHGETGWIVPPCDEQALCAAILRLATDRELIRRMGQAARIEAETTHGWDHTARLLEQVLSDQLRQ